jgi:Tol biopolymer transport system component
MRSLAIPFITAALPLLCIVSGLAAGPGAKTQPDRIAYISFQPSNWDIYLFTQPRKAPQRLTDYPGLEYDPVVSPDGHWLVFTSERRGNPDLYALNLSHGGEPRLLIDSERMKDRAAFSPDGKFIYFVSSYSGNADIYRLPFRPDKTVTMKDAQNLTHHPGAELRPSISPDGRTMAFSSDRDLPVAAFSPINRYSSGDIWTLNLVDGSQRRLTRLNGAGWNGSPKWSADGKQIVFYSSQIGSARGNRQSRIMIMDADGSNPRAVTQWETNALSPEFLPDGRIMYSRPNKQSRVEILSVNPDGSQMRIESDESDNSYWAPQRGSSAGSFVVYGTAPVKPEPQGGYHRAPGAEAGIFPDGPVLVADTPVRKKLPDRQIALYPIRYFSAILSPRSDLIIHAAPGVPPNPVELWASKVDGTQQHRILQLGSTQNMFTGISWSKDDQWIAFTRGGFPVAKSEADVWKMRPDGSDLQNLTPDTPGFDGYPSFSGDGKQIVFVSERNGNFDLYLMDADGSRVRRLTDDHATNLFAAFSPTSSQIAFVSNRDDPKSDIFDVYLLDLDANGAPKGIRRITRDEGQHGHVQYSYDGKWLIFTSGRGGINDEQPLSAQIQVYGELYAYRMSDGSMIRLTDNKWEDGEAWWEAPFAVK